MKKIILSLVLMSSSAAFAKTSLNCRDGHSWSSSTDLTQFRSSMNLTHNFATALLNCSSRIERAIERGVSFRCAGIWTFDHRRPDETVGTVAIVEFSKKEDQKWKAEFMTSYDYGREKINMDCNLNQTAD